MRRQAYNCKSYTSVMIANGLSANGSDPSDLIVKVFGTKKPKAEVTVLVGSFSESRGCGFSNGKKNAITDPGAVELCRGVIAGTTDVSVLVDYLCEKCEDAVAVGIRAKLQRWFYLASQINPDATVREEYRQRLFDQRSFATGDKVIVAHHGWGSETEVTVTGEEFKYDPYSRCDQGWFFKLSDGSMKHQGRIRKAS